MANKISTHRKEIEFILLMGQNGVGKEKKGQMLYLLAGNIYRIVMSKVIKSHRAAKTPLGLQFMEEIDNEKNGKLLSDNPVIEAFEDEVMRIYTAHIESGVGGMCRIIIDGFPRNMTQLKRFLTYRVSFIAFYITISEATCIARVNERAETEGPRNDDDKAADRYRELTEHNRRMVQVMKLSNPHSVVPINGELPMRDQITRMLKKAFDPRAVKRMVACLDNPTDAARKLMDEVEKRKPVIPTPPRAERGGASAHSITQRPQSIGHTRHSVPTELIADQPA
ncbi:MAG TPA: hypothetical protein VL335_03875 [Candidatus Paceibacterota bacterium]|nr:hypothetical protein [Candidatus Paceibacterota bacterium]